MLVRAGLLKALMPEKVEQLIVGLAFTIAVFGLMRPEASGFAV